MMLAGMDIARLNFSHGSHEFLQGCIFRIRLLNRKYRRHVRILADLEGHRVRIGRFGKVKEIPLKKRQSLILSNKPTSSASPVIPFDYRGSLRDIPKGVFIYIDDGNICLRVTRVTGDYVRTEVVTPGVLKERKGVNIPQANLKFRGTSPKDRDDIAFAIKHKVDFIAQSFVCSSKDLLAVMRLVRPGLAGCRVIAKIENRQGINNIDSIIKAADGIMIARGDMGVSIPLYEVPIVQKVIIKKCNEADKPVITATQMLESMTENRRPTRAEVADVANAVLDGSDCLMLSAETAVGKYPVESVEMMNKIISYTEKSLI